MRDDIFELLRNLRSLDQLKRLFWQQLNYDRVNQPLPIRDWSADESEHAMARGEHKVRPYRAIYCCSLNTRRSR